MKNKLILEKNLDFRQFQNLFILTFVTLMLFLAVTYSEEFQFPTVIKIIFGFLTLLFIAILFTKKGLLFETNKLYVGTFLFGLVLKKKLINTLNYQKLSLNKGKLSTNYAYSFDITEFHKWEPDLNQSLESFTLAMENENHKQKIIMLTKPEKIKVAIDFIIKNTNLNY